MRIYIIGNEFTGIFNNRRELIESLLNNGSEVYFSVNSNPRNKELIDMGCVYKELNISRRSKNVLSDIKLYLDILKIVKEIKPDLILTYNIKPVLYGSTIARIKSIPSIATITGLGKASQSNDSPLQKVFATLILKMYKSSLKKTESIFFQNEHDRSIFLRNKIGNPSNYNLVSGSGVNVDYYKVDKFKPQDVKVFLFIGRFIQSKGIIEYLQAAIEMKKTRPDLKFQILGKLEDQADIGKKIVELQSKGIIEYLGYSEDVRNEIAKADCVVLPSYSEGMSNVLLQSAAMKRVLLASNIPGCNEITEDGRNGFLFQPKSVKSLVEAIVRLINMDNDSWSKMGEESRLIVEEKFNKENVVRSYIEIIRKLGEK